MVLENPKQMLALQTSIRVTCPAAFIPMMEPEEIDKTPELQSCVYRLSSQRNLDPKPGSAFL